MKRIRIIEDDDTIRTELATLLLTNGYLPVEEDSLNEWGQPQCVQ